ncbi:MAG: sugar phosphate isomerase/epimerase [Chloroflexaceae bacterium]|jgi:sugar phosphate isomerase/epimerase|nr:sugar phosphate isomerase/epimerase [Chloroflexaceae bacterium]
MTIYVSTACLPGKSPLLQRLDDYAAAYLTHVELGAGVEVNHEELASLPWRCGQKFLIHNYFPPPAEPFVLNLASRSDSIRTRSLDLVCDALSLSARLEAPFYSVHVGFITDPKAFGTTSFEFPMPESPDETRAAFERFVSSLGQVLAIAREQGVQLLVENNVCPSDLRGKLLLQTPEEFLELFDVLPDASLGMLVDMGHLKVSAQTFGFDCLAGIEKLAPHIRAFHLHDNDGVSDLHWPVRPESWTLEVLRRAAFATLPIVVEAKFPDVMSLRQHVEWLNM